MHEQELKELGLTDNEVQIYLLLLSNGALNPGQISKKTGLHRGYIYDALERMQEKEVVSTVFISDKKVFQAATPKSLAEVYKLKLHALENAIPDLQKSMYSSNEEVQVSVHKGKTVFRTVIKDLLASVTSKEEVLIIGVDEQALEQEVEPIYLKRYLVAIKSKQITERVIIKKGSYKIQNKNISYKQLASEYIGNVAQIIYANKVALFLADNSYTLIIIQNKETAETYRKQFELLWKIASS